MDSSRELKERSQGCSARVLRGWDQKGSPREPGGGEWLKQKSTLCSYNVPKLLMCKVSVLFVNN